MAKKKTGPARMKELGAKKIEVWLSAAQAEAFEKMAETMRVRKATLARRAINQVVSGGVNAAYYLRGTRYD